MTRILAINGSYRENGVIDQAVEVAVQVASEAGAAIEVIYLREFPIEFCRNGRTSSILLASFSSPSA